MCLGRLSIYASNALSVKANYNIRLLEFMLIARLVIKISQ